MTLSLGTIKGKSADKYITFREMGKYWRNFQADACEVVFQKHESDGK